MVKLRSILFLIVVLALPLASVQADSHSLADVVAGDGQFSTLLELAGAAGIADALAAGGPITLFAPVNEAFAELPGFAVEWLAGNPEVLTELLLLHVVEGAHGSADLSSMDMVGALSVSASATGVMINDANVVVADISAANGVLHAIDRVLLPELELVETVPAFVDGDLIAAGSSTVFPLSDAIATRFRDEGYAGNITVDSIGSGAGFERFCAEGVTDISNASRPIKDAEVENCHAIGRSVFPLRVGTDALAVVINSENDFARQPEPGAAGAPLQHGGHLAGCQRGLARRADRALHPWHRQRHLRLLCGRGLQQGPGAHPGRGAHQPERG